MRIVIWILFAFLAVSLCLGCASALPPPAYAPPNEDESSAGRVELDSSPLLQQEPAESADPWGRDARADQLLGRIGKTVVGLAQRADDAAMIRDVVRAACLRDKWTAINEILQRAYDTRAAWRQAVFEDDDATADSSWATLANLEPEAERVRHEADECVGEEASYGATPVYAMVSGRQTSPEYTTRLAALEQRVTESKERVSRSRARMALLRDTQLAGSAGGGNNALAAGPTTAAGPTATPPSASAVRADAPHDPSMLIRTAQIVLAVYELERKMAGVERMATELGGYLALKTDRQVTVRVPRARFDEAVSRIERMGDVLHKSIAAEDVTDAFVDLTMRLKNATAVRARLEKLLESAGVKEAIEIQKELAHVTEEIERLQGKLQLLNDRIAFSTITVSFERTQPKAIRTQALLPFPWMNVMGLSPLLQVTR